MPVLGVFSICLVAQALAMIVDEFYFHRKRGLPKWERVGHPLDTLTVLSVFLSFAFVNPEAGGATPIWLWFLIGGSCLFITKDEWIHHSNCEAPEQWLHALQFVLHPLVFFAAWFVWREGQGHLIFVLQSLILFLFGLYQTFYWNVIRLNPMEKSHA